MGLLISCGGDKPAETTTTVTEQAAVINTTSAYICPMNCENSGSDKPGVCSVCGMDLVSNPNFKGSATDSTAAQTTDTTATEAGEATKDDHEGHNH